MAIDAKEIQGFIFRILRLSATVFIRMVRMHPFVSTLFFFLFLLYFYLPRVFIFLIYSTPIQACIAMYIRSYLPSKLAKILKDIKDVREHQATSTISTFQKADVVVSRNDESVSQSQTLSQRNVKTKSKELDVQAAKEEMEQRNVDSPDENVLIEEKPRGPSDKSQSFSSNVSVGDGIGASSKSMRSSMASLSGLDEQAEKSGGGGEAELESSSSEQEGEGHQESKNKAVEWTEDDKKNLMFLGISELERDKRLENLMARRRARKLFKMNTDKYLSHGVAFQLQVAPVLAARGNAFGAPNESEDGIPGSAPSLLPTRSPFDLPYDPLEEKPDLTGDSFQKEFKAAHRKDMFFCRHESFILGPSFSLEDELNDPHIAAGSWGFKWEQNKKKPATSATNAESIKSSAEKGDHDLLDYGLQNQNDSTLPRNLSITDLVTEEGCEFSNQADNLPEEDGEADHGRKKEDKMTENTHGSDSSLHKGSEIGLETYGVKDSRSKSSLSSLSSDESEPTTKAKKPGLLPGIQPPVFRFPDMVNSPSQNSDPCPIPKARGVNDICCLASPITIDRSSLDNHLLYTNNRPWHTPNPSIASDMQVEVSETGSPPSTGDGSALSDGGESLTYDGDMEKERASGSDEMWGVTPYADKAQQRDLTSREGNDFNREDITGGVSGFHTEPEDPFASSSGPNISQGDKPDSNNSDNRIPNDAKQHEENLHNPHESLNPSGKIAENVELSDSVNAPYHTNDDMELSKSAEGRNVGADISNISKVLGDLSNLAQKNNPESSRLIKSLDAPEQCVQEAEMATSGDVDDANVTKADGKSSEERNDKICKFIEQEVLADLLKQADKSNPEAGKNPESISDKPPTNFSFLIPTRDDRGEKNTREIEIFGVNQSLYHPSTSRLQPEMAEERVSTVVSISSSPKSVLPDRIPLAEISSDFNEHMQMDISDYDMKEKTVKDKLLDEQLPESSDLTSNHSSQHVTEDLTNNSSNNKPEKSEGSSDILEKSTDEATRTSNLDWETKEKIDFLLTRHGGPDASIRNAVSVEISKPPEEINSRSVEKINSASGNLVECEARNVRPKPGKEHQDPIVPAVTVTEKKSENPSQEFKQDADGNSGARNLTDTIPTNPAPESNHVDNIPVNIGTEDQILLQKYMDIKDEGAHETTASDRSEADVDGKPESEQLDKKQDTSEQANLTEHPTSVSIGVIKTGTRNLTEAAVSNPVQLQLARESGSASGMPNIDDAERKEGIDSSKIVEDIRPDSMDLTQDRI